MSKLTTMSEAIARYVPDGATVAIGLALEALIPHAAAHERHRLRERVDFVTNPGYGYPDANGPAGSAWRERQGLPRGGPSALITTLAVFTFDPANGEALLQSYHPGSNITEIQEQTGWSLRLAPDCTETVPPSAEELNIIRASDPAGVWTR